MQVVEKTLPQEAVGVVCNCDVSGVGCAGGGEDAAPGGRWGGVQSQQAVPGGGVQRNHIIHGREAGG